MRFTISPEQLKFFDLNGYLELEGLISSEETNRLTASIQEVVQKTPGYPHQDYFRSLPLIAQLARKRGWGEIAAALVHKKPLRIFSDQLWSSSSQKLPFIDRGNCGLLLDLDQQKGIFFKKNFPADPQAHYFLMVVTAKHLPENLHPVIFNE
jgi:hypothetical protein